MLLIRKPAERKSCAAIGTAVITCASGVISHKMNQHYANHATQAAPQSTIRLMSPVKGLTDQAIIELRMWSDLHMQGILTREEFTAMKARILGL